MECVEYLYAKYSEKGYDVLAITDHDTIGLELRDDELLDIKRKKYNLDIIVGMEYEIDINNEKVHLLCYFNNYKDISNPIIEYLEGYKLLIKAFDEKVKKIMWNKGVNIPDIDYSLINDISYMILLDEVVKRTGKNHSEWRKELRKYMKETELNIQIPRLSALEIVKEVHKSNGLIIMAHPLQFKYDTVLKAIRYGIDGLECFYPNYTNKESKDLINLADANNLLVTAGDDYHRDTASNKHGKISSIALEGEYLKKFMSALKN